MCNLKSNKSLSEILEYKKMLENINLNNKTLVLFPSAPYLPFFYDAKYHVGSQNISIYNNGSYTGEILAKQLKSLKVSYVLINHCEMTETEKSCILKIRNAVEENVKVVFCIGKNLAPKDNIIEKLKQQIKQVFDYLTIEEIKHIIIAYEPIWMIHQKNTLPPKEIAYTTGQIKEFLLNTYQQTNPVLYGGSIHLNNIDDLLQIDNLDGYLIGNCALNPENILKIAVKF